MAIKIIVDSTADLLPRLKEKCAVVPMTLRFGDEEYTDGVTITHQEFYEKLAASPVVPTTSQATPAAFSDVLKKTLKQGDSALILTVAQNFSGTYQSACIAAADYENVFVVETGSVAIGSGILVARAVELAESGLPAEQIVEILEEEKKRLRIVATVDTLEYLKKGGRISATAAVAGNLLNIKPIIAVIDGEVRTLGKARGAKQATKQLNQQIEKEGGVDFSRPILLGYTGTSDAPLLQYMEENPDLWAASTPYTCIGSVIGTHAGPGAIALAFFAKE